MKFIDKIKSVGWKTWVYVVTGASLLLGVIFKIWEAVNNRKTEKAVVITANKKVEEAFADSKDAAVEVAKADAKVEEVSQKIEDVVNTTSPESEERIEALTEDLAEMTRRRRGKPQS